MSTLQEFSEAAKDFEKNAEIGNSTRNLAMTTSREGEVLNSDQARKLDAVFEMLTNQQV